MNQQSFIGMIALTAVIWFALLGYRDLIEPDEGRYAEIPREMVTTGEWTTPRLNGFKYFAKPVLQYWATAASFTLFGQSNATARLWTALVGFLGALWIAFIATRLYGHTVGFYSFFITISSLLYVVMGHILTLDMSVSVFLVMAVTSLAVAHSQRDDKPHVRRWMLMAWAAVALAVLSKGLIGLVLPAGGILTYSLWQRDWALWRNLHIGKGLLLFLAITSPWFIAVSVKNPEFIQHFFINEHFQRYTSSVHEREGPLWYFVPYLLLGAVPWIAIIIRSLVSPGFAWRPTRYGEFDTERFFWAFAVAVFLFFSLGNSKLPPYILPIMPILAILAAKRLAADGRSRIDAVLTVLLAIVFLVAAIFITQFADSKRPAEMLLELQPWLFAAAVCMAVAALFIFKGNKERPLFFGVAGLAALLALQSVLWGYQTLAASRSNRNMAEAIRPHLSDDTKIYTAKLYYYPYTIAFYLGRNLNLVNYKGEMYMGIDLEPETWIATDEEFVRRWQDGNKAIAIMSPEGYKDFKAIDLPMQIVFRGVRSIAVTTP